MLDAFWEQDRSTSSAPPAAPRLVASVPVPLRDALRTRAPELLATADVFRRLLEEARTSIKIFSPYVDPAFTGLAEAVRAPMQIVTTLRETRMRSSPVLERFASSRPLAVRYLHERQASAQMFQLHAKTILADGERAYVGSANLTDTSLHYNFEMGLLIEDRAIVERLEKVFDYVFGFAARPAGRL
jgi:phosphatidylserine/phosphatidylglycerophosphate/cardiolipin synthase-like enzyme